MAVRNSHRDALRILNILLAGSSPMPESEDPRTTAIFRGETRLYAFDFWMRNPDYLAEELLDLHEKTGDPAPLQSAIEIFAAEEPDLRRFPMIRYKFGAFERLDDTLAILVSRNLVNITGVKKGGRVRETDFLLTIAAFDLARELVEEFPALAWYSERAKLVAALAGDRSGNALKARQYSQIEYAETSLGGSIPSIKHRVAARLQGLVQPLPITGTDS